MTYGYNLLEEKQVGHGAPWWDEYYTTTELTVIETNLYSSKEELDEKVKELKEKHFYELGDQLHLVTFEVDVDLKQ